MKNDPDTTNIVARNPCKVSKRYTQDHRCHVENNNRAVSKGAEWRTANHTRVHNLDERTLPNQTLVLAGAPANRD